MSQELKRMSVEASKLKSVILQDSNIDVLLYLAKYNPKVTAKDIVKCFGKKSLSGLKSLKEFDLIKDDKGSISLTNEGIFQVEGLMALVV